MDKNKPVAELTDIEIEELHHDMVKRRKAESFEKEWQKKIEYARTLKADPVTIRDTVENVFGEFGRIGETIPRFHKIIQLLPTFSEVEITLKVIKFPTRFTHEVEMLTPADWE